MPVQTAQPVSKAKWGARAVIAAITFFFLLYVLWVVRGRYDPKTENLLSSLGLIVFNFPFFYFSLSMVRNRRNEPALRWGWLLLCLALLSNATAEGLWFYLELILRVDPFPSIADPFYLLYYPLFLLGLLVFPAAPSARRERITLWLDLSIIMTTAGMVFWFYFLAPLSISAGQSLADVVALAYPVGDLLLIAGVLALIQRDIERVNQWTLIALGIGMLTTAVSDAFFAYYEINGLAYRMPLLNIGWLATLVAYNFAIYRQLHHENLGESYSPHFLATRRTLRLALPYPGRGPGHWPDHLPGTSFSEHQPGSARSVVRGLAVGRPGAGPAVPGAARERPPASQNAHHGDHR